MKTFDEWWDGLLYGQEFTSKDVARQIWDAAQRSAKESDSGIKKYKDKEDWEENSDYVSMLDELNFYLNRSKVAHNAYVKKCKENKQKDKNEKM